jgi:Na+-transporting methylmalonyl-CoA/oxaloacetate decarboxylase gamma subunit
VDEVIGIIGQAVLILIGLALVFFLVFAILLMTKAIRRLSRELRQPDLPPTDAYIPPSFDRS